MDAAATRVVRPARPGGTLTLGRLTYRRYWGALYHRDVDAAARIVDQCLREWTPPRIYLQLFEPALVLSGQLFAMGRIGYGDEHFVTHHTLRLMRRVRRRFVPAETYGPLAMATGVGQESHLIGLRMVCDFLQHANWRIHWLSSNDRGVVGHAVTRLNPAALLLSLGTEAGVEPARRMAHEVRRAGYDGLLIVGGAAINRDRSLVERIGADLTAPNGLALVRLLRGRVPHPWHGRPARHEMR